MITDRQSKHMLLEVISSLVLARVGALPGAVLDAYTDRMSFCLVVGLQYGEHYVTTRLNHAVCAAYLGDDALNKAADELAAKLVEVI